MGLGFSVVGEGMVGWVVFFLCLLFSWLVVGSS